MQAAAAAAAAPLPTAVAAAAAVDLTSELQILNPHQYWRCVDVRGANFRIKPDPEALVGDGSGVDPGETVRVAARTKNWLKLDTTHMKGAKGSRWVPLRMCVA